MTHKLCFHKLFKTLYRKTKKKICFLQPTEQRAEVSLRIYCHSRQRQGVWKVHERSFTAESERTMCFVALSILQKNLCVFHPEAELLEPASWLEEIKGFQKTSMEAWCWVRNGGGWQSNDWGWLQTKPIM